jgi:hypothetical protein
VILLKILGVANVSKREFTLRSWQRSSLDITLHVISNKSSKGRFVMWSSMMMNTAVVPLAERIIKETDLKKMIVEGPTYDDSTAE